MKVTMPQPVTYLPVGQVSTCEAYLCQHKETGKTVTVIRVIDELLFISESGFTHMSSGLDSNLEYLDNTYNVIRKYQQGDVLTITA